MTRSPAHGEHASAEDGTAADETAANGGATVVLRDAVGARGAQSGASFPRPAANARQIGRYLVIEEIGRGGMGVVLRAYDPRLHREVALKQVRTDDLTTDAQARMLREAQAMAKLSHPNVVAVYDVEIRAGNVVMAMEYVQGTTLGTWLAQPHAWREVVAMFCAAGRGLAAAHEAGLLHRDFKPANVLVGTDGRVRVTDFGLARIDTSATASSRYVATEQMAELTGVGEVMGTPRYMAPEQHEGGVVEASADQYAFCVSLWEGLTGAPPFASAEAKLGGPPAWPRQVTLPAVVREALRRGLAVDPRERWPSMDALLQALAYDPSEQRRRWTVAAVTVATLAASSTAWAAHRQQLGQRCTGAESHLAQVWNDERRAATQQAFAATGVVYADEAWQQVAPQIDRYTSAWVASHQDACEATTVRDEQPPAVMDLRMACLHRSKVELNAVTHLLTRADAQVVEQVHSLVASLPAIDRCSDIEALKAQVPPPAPADEAAVEAIRAELAEVKALREAGKYPQALARVLPLPDRAQQLAYRPVHTDLLVELGLAHDHAGAYPEAERALKLALRSALASKQWEAAVFAASRLVDNVSWHQSRPLDAMAHAQTALGLLSIVDPAAEADLRSSIGSALEVQVRYAEAEVQRRAAVAVAERLWGPEHLNVATYRESLGVNLVDAGHLQAAETEFRSTLRLREQGLPKQHPLVAHAHLTLGVLLEYQGRYTEAEKHERAAVAAYEQVLGSEHPDTVSARGALASVLGKQGRHQEAEAEYQRLLRAQRQTYGYAHHEVATTLFAHTVALIELGRYGEAETQARDGVQVAETLYGKVHDVTANHRSLLAGVLNRRERYLEGEMEAREALAIAQKIEHPLLNISWQAHNNLGAALLGQGRYREAEQELRKALATARSIFEDGHPLLARIHIGLGAALERQGRYEEAEAEQREALEIQSEKLPPEHPHAAVTRGRLGNTLLGQRRFAEAETEYRKAWSSWQASGQDHHPDAAETVAGLGALLIERGQLAEALRLLERGWKAWQDDERVKGGVRGELAFALARALRKTGDRDRAGDLARRAQALFGSESGVHVRERAALRAWLSRR